MHALPSTLTALVVTMLGTATGAAARFTGFRRANDGNPSASKYTDAETNISFLGYESTTGFKFGMALPSSPTTDLIVQIVSPLQDGGGWGSIDFGSEMTGYLMIVAWPDTTASPATVKISPRVATGYEVSNGANVYAASNLTLTPIPAGTFVNDTHVAATFVCGGCVDATKSFGAGGGVASGKTTTSTFSYAYALKAVSDPGDQDTQLSDHMSNGELYGPFDVALADAESAEYESWAAMTTSKATASGSAAPAAATGSSSGSSGSGSSSSSSSGSSSGSSSSSSSSGSSSESDEYGEGLNAGAIVALTGLGFVYVLQALQII